MDTMTVSPVCIREGDTVTLPDGRRSEQTFNGGSFVAQFLVGRIHALTRKRIDFNPLDDLPLSILTSARE